MVSPSREPGRLPRTFMRNSHGKSEADCSHNAEKCNSYFPYGTIILLPKRIRDKSCVPYGTVILHLKAQEIGVSDTLHIYIIYKQLQTANACILSIAKQNEKRNVNTPVKAQYVSLLIHSLSCTYLSITV